MSETLSIFLNDLTPESQEVVLKFYNMDNPSEGNFGVIPLFVLEYEGENDDKNM